MQKNATHNKFGNGTLLPCFLERETMILAELKPKSLRILSSLDSSKDIFPHFASMASLGYPHSVAILLRNVSTVSALDTTNSVFFGGEG